MTTASVKRRGKPTREDAAAPAVLCVFADRDEQIVIPASARTLDGFRAWVLADDFPERGRYSFLDGELWIDMSPEALETHSRLKAEIGSTIQVVAKKYNLGLYYPDGVLVTNVDANLSTEPDSSFVSWQSLESGRVQLTARKEETGEYIELQGSPDWVLEIVSKHSVRKDTKRLRELYFKAGVREYWLADARGEEIDFQVLRRGPDGFEPTPAVRGWFPSAVFGRKFKLTRERGTMNFWQYTLHVKK